MSDSKYIKLRESAIIKAPFNMYEKNFVFIVNGKEFPTSRFIADLLSPKIRQLHSIDSSSSSFIIDTQESGDFSILLDLINFDQNNISEQELPFISEVIEILNSDSIELNNPDNSDSLSIEKVFDELKIHERNKKFFHTKIEREIEFAASHFYEIDEDDFVIIEQMCQIEKDTLNSILSSPKLFLKTEDQLLRIINSIYSNDRSYFQLYEYVQFVNIESENILKFLEVFNMNDLTNETWQKLSIRLQQDTKKCQKLNERYKFDSDYVITAKSTANKIEIQLNDDNQFDGIINFIRKQSLDKIQDSVEVTASSIGNSFFSPSNIIEYETNQLYFYTKNKPSSWIRIDFKNKSVCPKYYTLRTDISSDYHPKSWVIEGSFDKVNWEKIDQQNNCNLTNGRGITQTFEIKSNNNNKNFRYIQMRMIGKNWIGSNLLDISAIEFHGSLFFNSQ